MAALHHHFMRCQLPWIILSQKSRQQKSKIIVSISKKNYVRKPDMFSRQPPRRNASIPIIAFAPPTLATSSSAFTRAPPAAHALHAMPTFAINATINPRRCGGASNSAQARTSAAARPAPVHSFKPHVSPSGASVSRPFTPHSHPVHPPFT